eukprot:7495085-Ditylum_brightwellii.AAC.1
MIARPVDYCAALASALVVEGGEDKLAFEANGEIVQGESVFVVGTWRINERHGSICLQQTGDGALHICLHFVFCPCGKAIPLCLCIGRGLVVEERECYVVWSIALWSGKLGK